MFRWRQKTVAVELAGRRLVLAPLPVEMIAPMKTVLCRIITGVHPPIPPTWFQDLRQAMQYVYLAAKEHDPQIDLSDLGRPTVEEASKAISELWILTHRKSFWRHR